MLRFWVIGCLLLAPAACSTGRADPARKAPPAFNPQDLTVRRGRFEDRFLLTGQLSAVRAENLSVPKIPAWETTVRWLEEDGATVKRGQKVVEFDTASFAQALGEKRFTLDQALSDLEQAQVEQSSQKADKEFQIAQKSIAVEKAKIAAATPAEFLRGKDYEENQLALVRATTALEKAREDLATYNESSAETQRQKQITVDKAQRELDAATQAMEGMTLEAPRDGILVVADHPWHGRKIQVGDSVWVGMPIASLPDLREMRVFANLSDVDDGRIGPGLPVRCILDAYPEQAFSGRIAEITPVAQEAAGRSLRRAYTVRIELDGSDPDRMRPGMSVKVEVGMAAQEGVLLAPRAGLDLAGPHPRARLARGGEVDVVLGPCNRDRCVVTSGVEEGARLRSSG